LRHEPPYARDEDDQEASGNRTVGSSEGGPGEGRADQGMDEGQERRPIPLAAVEGPDGEGGRVPQRRGHARETPAPGREGVEQPAQERMRKTGGEPEGLHEDIEVQPALAPKLEDSPLPAADPDRIAPPEGAAEGDQDEQAQQRPPGPPADRGPKRAEDDQP